MDHAASDRFATYELQLHETNHRCSNDLQMVVSLLSIQTRRAKAEDVRIALSDATARVQVLAKARSDLIRMREPNLVTVLREALEALCCLAEPRGILIAHTIEGDVDGLAENKIVPVVMAVNELVTNAIKHAFADDRPGTIEVSVRAKDDDTISITVDDDGLPLSGPCSSHENGMGTSLVRRLVASIGGSVVFPIKQSKRFEIRIPTN